MADTDSVSSEELELKRGKPLEHLLGFNPSGTRNYMFTVFNKKTLKRTLLFGGAVPFHKASLYLLDFYKDYMDNVNNNCIYHMSVILDTKNNVKETDTLNIIELDSSHKLSERRKRAKESLKTLYYKFDSIYASYIDSDKKYVKDYRTYVGFKEFLDSRNMYISNKQDIKTIVNSLEEEIVNTD
tara:strand:+ start:6326 stop:6877 length:552 start_codon:yes stop_codon:yes gene_type:complete